MIILIIILKKVNDRKNHVYLCLSIIYNIMILLLEKQIHNDETDNTTTSENDNSAYFDIIYLTRLEISHTR